MKAANSACLKRKADTQLIPTHLKSRKLTKPKVYKVSPGQYLGLWRYTKELSNVPLKVYVSLEGRVLEGSEACSAYKVPLIQSDKTTQPLPSQYYNPSTLEHWGIPPGIAERVRAQGLPKLFDWQVACLDNQNVLKSRKNLVFCAPTSGGKSLVAEILLIRSALEHRKRALYIVPYISIVQEKFSYLHECLSPVLKAGDKAWNPFIDISICTIEKAYGIVNKLLEDRTPEFIGCVVIDELHMLGEAERGGLLETLIMKLKVMKCQVIGMSATLPDAEKLANWLEAEFYRGEYRPVPLVQYMVVDREVKDTELHKVRVLKSGDFASITLSLETIASNAQAIIFCSSKTACEDLALKIAKQIPPLSEELEVQARSDLQMCSGDTDSVLSVTLPRGVAYHHADLSSQERALVETYYRSQRIKVLTSTTTLAAGVNLPASRVIIHSPYMGSQQLTCRAYRQMCGRAGRSVGQIGESYLLVTKKTEALGIKLMTGDLESVESGLKGGVLKRAVVDGLAAGLVIDEASLETFVLSSYRARTQPDAVVSEAFSILADLRSAGLVIGFQGSPVLKATFASMLPPDVGVNLNSELLLRGETAHSGSRLFWMYLITSRECRPCHIDWSRLLTAMNYLETEDRKLVKFLSLDDETVAMWAVLGPGSDIEQLPYIRLAAGLALTERMEGVSVTEVAKRFGVSNGIVQSWEMQADAMCGMMVVYCQRIGLWMYASVFSSLQDRLSRVSSDSELQSLLQLPALKPFRAKVLYRAGLKDPQTLTQIELSKLEEVLLRGETQFQLQTDSSTDRLRCKALAEQIKNQAKTWTRVQSELPLDEEEITETGSESECDVAPVSIAGNLDTYIESALEAEEFRLLLQEAAKAVELSSAGK